ncbi:MAG: HAMP domain-containing protein [Nitrospirae bacterium]|nr:HAMP domain-containing protein [Nitrospirota bacterium]
MKYLKTLLWLFAAGIIAIIITGLLLNYLGIKHGPLLAKIGVTFLAVNVILYLLVLIVFVTQNLITLYYEKKQKVIGSRFRTKLVSAFVALTLIPSVLLFILSRQLIDNTIEKWFAIEVQRPLNDSMDIARKFYSTQSENLLSYARLLAENKNINIQKKTEGYLRAYSLKQPDGTELVDSAFKGAPDTETVPSENGDTIRAAVPVKEGGRITSVILTEITIPRDTVKKMEAIEKAYNEYHQTRTLQNPVKFIYFLILTITTLLIIFLALWAALRIARGIAVPIKSLAEATSLVANGNLDTTIPLKRDDEIGLLINSFNRMVKELKDGRLSLQEAYAESDRRRLTMEAILENINTGVIFLERSGRVITLNNAAGAMLDVTQSEVVGKSHRELLKRIKSEELDSIIEQIGRRDSFAAEREIQAIREGKPLNLRVYITTLKDSGGNFVGVLVVFDDITNIIKAQRALAWQEVARRIAHEIKNPLTPIKLSAERLIKKWQEKSEDFEDVLKRATTTIVKETDSLRVLVDEFSKFGKMPKINLTRNNIKTIIEEAVSLYNDFKEVIIVTSLADTPDIEIDREQIKRALINLIDNAIQAKTQHIWLNTFYEPYLELVRIEVIDDGAGIKEEDRDKLFQPYFSTKKEGTGLGLAIVDRIITGHRGYIRVKDNEPKGTQFIIELPVK